MTDETGPKISKYIEFDENILVNLSPKVALFVKNYITNGFNKSKAASDAGYKTKGTSARLMKLPEVDKAIKELKESWSKQSQWSVKKTVDEIDDCIAAARAKNQYTAVAAMLKLKGTATGTIIDTSRFDMNVATRGHLNIQIVGVKPPPYAEGLIDVTPEKKKIDGSTET